MTNPAHKDIQTVLITTYWQYPTTSTAM